MKNPFPHAWVFALFVSLSACHPKPTTPPDINPVNSATPTTTPAPPAAKTEAGTSSSTIEGHHDDGGTAFIAGWAWDKTHPEQRVKVDIYSGDELVLTVTADQFRPDLKSAGIGDGKYSFNVPAPKGLKDGRPHTITLKTAGTDLPFFGTPKVVVFSP